MTRGRAMGLWTGRLAIIGMLATAIAGCQALKDALPTKPSEPKPAPSQSPVSIPVVLPQPTPTPVLGGPAPAPTPTPANPGPNPTPTRLRLRRPEARAACRRAATRTTTARCRTRRSWAPWTRRSRCSRSSSPRSSTSTTSICENCYFVKDESAYAAGVIKNLNAAGYCAKYDGEELGVKNYELLQRAVRHPDLVGPHPPRRWLLPQHLQPRLVLTGGPGALSPRTAGPENPGPELRSYGSFWPVPGFVSTRAGPASLLIGSMI